MVESSVIKKSQLMVHATKLGKTDEMQSLPVVVNKSYKPFVSNKSPFDSVFMLNEDSEEDLMQIPQMLNKVPLTTIKFMSTPTGSPKMIPLEKSPKTKMGGQNGIMA